MNDTDAELYEQVHLGEKQALEKIYDRYEKLLFSLSYKITGQKELAEEVVQEVFIKLWTKKGIYSASKGKFSSWLMTMTRNTSIDQLRKRKEIPSDFEYGEIPSENPSVENLVEWKEEGSMLRQAISELGAEQQKMVDLFYFKGLSQQHIADEFDIPLGTVKGRIRLALKHLKKMVPQTNVKGGK
ncbi:sigma-70 family RNA polymerase sigma factor [Peribacillus cavernae]|uniref:Sigma-70 family RNA polymerase sigma factor n=1 Tax=Peribacillus cavernae TaxID=1674310 RepID=A0A433HC69_9BACI|nr:sigma-70 family RNA polymerase sigma factor [Peribacillus cavernae]MDQ0219725.1 RNA polymerase sigma-70 factor (ECF subfamily) [Peribacillus cavernae]RUQ26000.1 sigma-70 family RNA polymerase sigma factor [Peribacillus cavernae]